MASIDRHAVGAKTGEVLCPLRDKPIAVTRCLECTLLTARDREDPPRYVVCDARVVTGWLGLDDI